MEQQPMRNGKIVEAKEKTEGRIVENISPENSPNKGEPSVAERYVKTKIIHWELNLKTAILPQL